MAPTIPGRFAITCAGEPSRPSYLRTPGGGGGPGVAGPIASAGPPTGWPGGGGALLRLAEGPFPTPGTQV
jgi:hypothetical protein